LNKGSNKATAMSEIRRKLFSELTLVAPQIGEAFSIGEVERVLNSLSLVNRVNSVKIVSKDGVGYSDVRYSIQSNVSPDGGLVYLPENFIWELKKEKDITGKIQ